MENETTHIASVFHDGELKVQQQAGVSEKVAKYATKAIRSFMPDQHREFYQQLPMILMGLTDQQGRPWATAAFGEQGFITSPDENSLLIKGSALLADELNLNTGQDSKVGLLGIELETRRRNRMNGYINSNTNDALHIHVDQSFGNCPQYIQRHNMSINTDTKSLDIRRSKTLNANGAAFIEDSDTFYIASRTPDMSKDSTSGVDVSHRGGRTGFVKVEQDGSISFPDFSGNRFFNTLGNIEADGRVGLFFPDFATGNTLFLTGWAEIRWDDPRIASLKGAERIINVKPDEIVMATNALPLRGEFIDSWPNLKNTGVWGEQN
ncbi:pyridoxamine 5'-phosphate oxidase family protein [Kordiimonas aquimaris]|uniref:pyridoxamine 5'-phosphate oxidase family protein n=1 Tax=Kordiimonas aquimaris TaxID=707591 RepID=UPI0021D3599D|nr:pyridoxamine 5'-phosphate oxidase family protein [Kordiimonas aquimaris]